MAGYTKLFSSIVTSTIWCQDTATRIVWISMLALKDRDGRVDGTIPGFARVANVTVEEMERAEKILSSPDPHSRTPDNEGRRIEAVPGGWLVLNHELYRGLESEEHRREMDAARQRRRREKEGASRGVTDGHGPSPHTDADTDTDANPKPPKHPAPKAGAVPDNPVNRLQEIFRACLEKADGAEAKFNYGHLGKLVKARMKTMGEQEIEVRVRNWFASTDAFIVANRNNVGMFDSKFHHLKGGPIHGKRNDTKPKNGFRPSGGHDARQPAGGGGGVPAKGGGGGVVL